MSNIYKILFVDERCSRRAPASLFYALHHIETRKSTPNPQNRTGALSPHIGGLNLKHKDIDWKVLHSDPLLYQESIRPQNQFPKPINLQENPEELRKYDCIITFENKLFENIEDLASTNSISLDEILFHLAEFSSSEQKDIKTLRRHINYNPGFIHDHTPQRFKHLLPKLDIEEPAITKRFKQDLEYIRNCTRNLIDELYRGN